MSRLGRDVDFFARPGPCTTLSSQAGQAAVSALVGEAPVDVCRAVQGLIIQPGDAAAAGVEEARMSERNLRSADLIISRALELDPAPLEEPRTPDGRVVGTCRHFAVLATALLRHGQVPARARCGFGTYFVSGQAFDHWVIERWSDDVGRWVRVDVEHLDAPLGVDTADLPPGAFLTGGEAWARYRAGSLDPGSCGVPGTDHAWGVGEIRGNLIRDLAALARVEVLPWDEWGRMTDSYADRTGADYDHLMDAIAAICAGAEPHMVLEAYRSEDLEVPASFTTGAWSIAVPDGDDDARANNAVSGSFPR